VFLLDIECNSSSLLLFLSILKKGLSILWVVGPILAIISLTISFSKIALFTEEEKKEKNKMKNSIIALIVVFFIPIIVTFVLDNMGSNFKVSSCWAQVNEDDAKNLLSSNSKYQEVEKVEKTNAFSTKEYDEGEEVRYYYGANCVDYSYEGNGTVKKKTFSSGTMKIVENHLYDFNYLTYPSVDGENYIKSLGGIFSKYFGLKMQVTKASELQEVSEYVFGLMYMYGFDYFSGASRKYCKWGGRDCSDCNGTCPQGESGSSDAFYTGNYMYWQHGLSGPLSNFDKLILGSNMTTNCNWTVDMVYYKAGLFGGEGQPGGSASGKSLGKKYQIITDKSDIQVGDLIQFFHESDGFDKTNPDTWTNWYHVAFIGEIDRETNELVGYDGGSYFMFNKTYKWRDKIDENVDSIHGSKTAVAIRITDLEQDCG